MLGGIKSQIETITPEAARRYLETSEGNRRTREHMVKKYANDIKGGNWQLNGEPIVFNSNGRLKDGHHRLKAIIVANKPMTTFVVRGVSVATDIWDRGAVRSTGDNLKFAGEEAWVYDKTQLSTARFCLFMEQGCEEFSDAQIVEFMYKSEETFKTLYALRCRTRTQKSGGTLHTNRAVLSAVYYALKSGVEQEELAEFVKVLNSGFYSEAHETSAIVLRNMLLSTTRKSGCTSFNRRWSYVAQEAIKSWCDRKPRKLAYKGICGVYSQKYEHSDSKVKEAI